MDSDFMNNLANAMKNGNIPDSIKNLMNNMKADNTQNAENAEGSEGFENAENSRNSGNFNDFSGFGPFGDSNNGMPNIDINTLLKMKSIMEKMNSNKDDPRSNLLLSLKPYLKESRRNKVEQYVQFLNMKKIIDAFNQTGGENTK